MRTWASRSRKVSGGTVSFRIPTRRTHGMAATVQAPEEVEVDGVRGRVPGSIAFVSSTQSWLPPMRRAYRGVLGSQDVNICR